MCVLYDCRPKLDISFFSPVNEEGFEHALTAADPQRPLFLSSLPTAPRKKKNTGMIRTEFISRVVFFWRHWDADFIRGTNTVSCSHEINSAGCRAPVKIIQRPTSSTRLGKKTNAKCATKHPHLSELSNLEIGL